MYTNEQFFPFINPNVASGGAAGNNPRYVSAATAGAVARFTPTYQPVTVKALQIAATGAIHATNPIFSLRVATSYNGTVTGEANKCTLTIASGAAAARVVVNQSFTPFSVKPGQQLVLNVNTANGGALSVEAGFWGSHSPESLVNCTQVTLVTG